MTTHTDDRALADWLTEGPTAYPSHAFDATIDQLDRVPQRRLWGFPGTKAIMNKVVPASIAAVVVVAVGAYLLMGATRNVGTDPVPPSEAPSPQSMVFTSERHGYTLTLPSADWDVVDTAVIWSPGKAFPYPGGDILVRDGTERYPTIHIGSQPVPSGLTFDDWLADYDADHVTLFYPGCRLASEERAELNGVVWRYASYVGCGDDWMKVEALAIHDGTAYIMRASGPAQSLQTQGISLRESLDDWMSRLSLPGS